MRKRLIFGIVAGLAGLALASPLNSSLELPPSVAMAGFSIAGAVLGYVGGILFEVFTASPEENSENSGQ